MPKIVGLMVVKNEVDRYLQSCLEWNVPLLDELFVVDDQSTDDTVEMCRQYTENVLVRTDDVPSFMEHEGKFRQYAWDSMNVSPGDWIFVFDADEFFCGTNGTVVDHREALESYISWAERAGDKSITLPIVDIWGHDGVPYRRMDTFWATNVRTCLVNFSKNKKFTDKPMGCFSVPKSYVSPTISSAYFGSLFHVGFLESADRQVKYERYKSLPNHGHSDKHINSIITKPTLREYPGITPKFWRGIR